MSTVQITGTEMLDHLMSHFKMTARKAMLTALEKHQLSNDQRNQRQGIRNAYWVENVSVIEAGKEQQDEFGKLCLQELLDECKQPAWG